MTAWKTVLCHACDGNGVMEDGEACDICETYGCLSMDASGNLALRPYGPVRGRIDPDSAIVLSDGDDE